MADKAERLKATIHQLHDELSALDPVDPEVRDLLAEALGDIQSALKQPSGSVAAVDEASESPSLVARITDAARHFESSHPTLSDTLSKIADLVAQIGI